VGEGLLAALCLLMAAGGEPAGLVGLTLDQAIGRALARNPDVLTAAQEVRRAEGLVGQARSSSLPDITPQGTYTRLDAARRFMGMTVLGVNQVSAGVPVAIPLVVPQAWAEWAHAIDDRRVAELGVGQVRRQVAIAVANAYLTVITQRRLQEIATLSRDTAASHADYTRQQAAAGAVSELDAVRAQQQLHTTQAQVESTTVALAQAREALGVLVGGDQPVDALVAPRFRLPGPDDQLELRSDLVWLRMQQTAAHHQLRDSYTELLPYLTGLFGPAYTDPPTFTQPRWGWQLQLTLVIPLYDGGLRAGRRLVRGALLEEATLTLDARRRAGRADIRLGYQSLVHAEARVNETRTAAALAHRALEISTLRYRQGATTNIEVIDAEQQARQSDLAAALAEDDAQLTRLTLLAAAGGFP
jgi:outer membrane protein TolC